MKPNILLVLVLLFPLALGAQERTFTLEECKEIALQNNNEVRKAQLDIKGAKAMEGEVAVNFFPTASLTGMAFHAFNPLISINALDVVGDNPLGNAIQDLWQALADANGGNASLDLFHYAQHYGIMAIQPVFAGGRIVNGFRYAKLGSEAARLKAEMTSRDVMEEVEKNYYGLLSLMEKEKYLNSLQELIDTLDKVAGVALGEGVILRSDHMLLQNKKLELKNGMVKLRAGMRLMKMNLLNSIGCTYRVMDLDSYHFTGCIAEGIPSPDEVYRDENEVVASLTETKLLELQVKAKKFDKKLTLGSTLPQIGLGVSYGYTRLFSPRPGRWNGMVFAAVSIPLTDWAKNSYKMQRQQTEIEKAEYDRDHLGEMLVLQQRKFFLELTSAWDALTLARSQKEYALYQYEQAKVQFEAGYTTTADLLQAYSGLSEATETESTALSDYLTALQVYRSRLPQEKSGI